MATSDKSASGDTIARVQALVAELCAVPAASLWKIRRELLALPAEDVFGPLQQALREGSTFHEYQRIASALARLPHPNSLEPLEEHIRSDHPFTSAAIRALELSGRGEALALLAHLMGHVSRKRARQIARALARQRYVPGLAAIAQHIVYKNRRPDSHMVSVVPLYGRPRPVLEQLVMTGNLSPEMLVDTVLILQATVPGWRRLAVERVFETLSRKGYDTQRACRLYRDRTTLLRPSQGNPHATLLRPASGVSGTTDDRLVRPSAADEVSEPPPQKGFLRRLLDAVLDTISRDE